MHWKSIITYTATYKAGKKGKGKATLIVRTINKPPPPEREFRLASSDPKPFKRTRLTKSTRKAIIIMATGKTKDKKGSTKKGKTREKPVEDETLEELTDLEDVEELAEDEDEETTDTSTDDSEDTDDDDDDEEVEKPKSKKDKKGKKKKGKTSRAKANGKVGSQEVAEAGGVDARTLRMVLRKHSIEKDEESNRYEWDSLEHPTVKKILKLIKEGAAKDVKKEGLDKLKAKKAAEKGEKKGKKGKKDKKKKKEEDNDE